MTQVMVLTSMFTLALCIRGPVSPFACDMILCFATVTLIRARASVRPLGVMDGSVLCLPLPDRNYLGLSTDANMLTWTQLETDPEPGRLHPLNCEQLYG